MAKKQTRRSVSIRGSTYEQIRDYCESEGMSMSEFVEARIASFFGNSATEKPSPIVMPKLALKKTVPPKQPLSADEEERLSSDEMQEAARFFTF